MFIILKLRGKGNLNDITATDLYLFVDETDEPINQNNVPTHNTVTLADLGLDNFENQAEVEEALYQYVLAQGGVISEVEIPLWEVLENILLGRTAFYLSDNSYPFDSPCGVPISCHNLAYHNGENALPESGNKVFANDVDYTVYLEGDFKGSCAISEGSSYEVTAFNYINNSNEVINTYCLSGGE